MGEWFDPKTLQALLGLITVVMIPAIAAVFAYKKEQSKPPATIGHAGLMAIGGALASEGEMFLYVDALKKQSQSLDINSEAMTKLAQAYSSMSDNKELVEELTKIRRALEEANGIAERRMKAQ